ncbi:MAG: hypothetical protein AAGE94_03025 [Acidobacteriota bacterium]
MTRSLRMASILFVFILSSSLASAETTPTIEVDTSTEPQVESSTSTESPSLVAGWSERSSDFLLIEPEWMAHGKESQPQRDQSIYGGYCLNDCSSCYPVGSANPSCTSPEFPGAKFPCTAIPLC